ncbi:unnamed protein product [Mytilus edulis]|uniref:Uncharacterized protein n=1 Tax=Mytilus edulis TaxID=6550 RepID=A0A8S3UDM0_MYTED|nr:unnamed protein product [Mytilus edulis]
MSYEEFLLQAESSREDNIAPENLPLIVDQHDAISVASDIHHTQNEAYNTVAYDRSEIREDSNEESYPGHKSNLLSLNTPYSKLARSSENNRSISDTNIEKAGSELPTACTGFTKTIKHEDQLRTINILRSMSDGNVNQTCSLDKMHRNTTDLSSTHSMNRRTPNHKISKTSLSRQSSENSFENLRKLGLCGSQGSLSHYSSRKSLSHHSSRRSLSHHSSGKSIRTYFRRNIRNQSSNKSLRFQANSSSSMFFKIVYLFLWYYDIGCGLFYRCLCYHSQNKIYVLESK